MMSETDEQLHKRVHTFIQRVRALIDDRLCQLVRQHRILRISQRFVHRSQRFLGSRYGRFGKLAEIQCFCLFDGCLQRLLVRIWNERIIRQPVSQRIDDLI